MDEFKIRPYKEQDKPYLEEVCHKTATAKKYIRDKSLVCTLYLHYYLEHEPQNCFVAADEDDRPIGYIVCAEDYGKYIDIFMEKYLPKVKKKDKMEALLKKLERRYLKKVCKNYPAHLHIDILPCGQNQGVGKKLMKALISHLKSKDIGGIFLVVGSDNERAVRFYKKLGYETHKSIFGKAYVMTMKL
ncbi:MAG: GNAT family N-acetyltransferase [Clostridiales bacterium]|nr:GNAT family N-acetyltransferase [Clostridiales bacterium]